jgi:transcriptional regulator with PAS, ATPase and Fis domain
MRFQRGSIIPSFMLLAGEQGTGKEILMRGITKMWCCSASVMRC